MDYTWLADRLDGRPRVVVSTTSTGTEFRRELWVAYLYGYRPVEHRSAVGSGSWTVLVRDAAPTARRRAEFMRNPDLGPEAASPVEWADGRAAGRLAPPWAPPGWPAWAGPVPPPDDLLPQIPPRDRRAGRRTLWLASGVITAWMTNAVRWAWSGTPGTAELVVSGSLGTLVLLGGAVVALRSRRPRWGREEEQSGP